MRAVTVLLLLFLLGACGSRSAEVTHGPALAAPARLGQMLFGDIKPHDWDHRSPARHEVHGIDVSRWQGNIDWHRVRRAGISFAFIKATEGGDVADPLFTQNWKAARLLANRPPERRQAF
ncbi:MAG: GH25 family lysozyme [Qingshengfaniella sp.]